MSSAVNRSRKKIVIFLVLALVSICFKLPVIDVKAEGNNIPILRGIKVLKEKSLRPGKCEIELDVCEEEHGICGVSVQLVYIEGDIYDYANPAETPSGFWAAKNESQIVHDGKIKVDIDVPEKGKIGRWRIKRIDLNFVNMNSHYVYEIDTQSDYVASLEGPITGKHFDKLAWWDGEKNVIKDEGIYVGDTLKYRYTYYDVDDDVVYEDRNDSVPAVEFDVVDDTDFYAIYDISESELEKKIKNTPEGETVGLMMPKDYDLWKHTVKLKDKDENGEKEVEWEASKITKEMFNSIKGKNINLVVLFGSFRWVFNGKNITNPKDVYVWFNYGAYYNPGEQPDESNNYHGGKVQGFFFWFAPNGDLPGRAEIRVKWDALEREGYGEIDSNISLFYNDNGKFVLEKDADCKLIEDKDKWFSFYIDHNSEFVASKNDLSGKNANEKQRKSEWYNGKWYDADGKQTYQYTGEWKGGDNGWWFEDTSGWYPQDQWLKIDGYWYYFKPDGYMAMDEYYKGCWFGSNGVWDEQYKLSWKSNSTGWWVEDKSSWWPSSQWLKIDGSWYYFTSDGYMDYGEYRDGCWLGSDGAMDPNSVNGAWHSDGKGWYYSDNGWYPKNQYLWIDGTSYWFDSSGYCN